MTLEETWEVEVMTSTSTKLSLLTVLTALMLTTGLATHQTGSITGDDLGSTGFEVPQYDSQQEILAQLVAPFLFITILLQLLYGKVLHFIFEDKDQTPYGAPHWVEDSDKPDVRKYATLMAISTTAVLVPTPFWTYVTWATISLPMIVVTMIVIIFLIGAYRVLSRL